jgi:acyl transferase domain-containing protein/NADPH:quinone reductase-like Zn-dependent oxidoreductase/acyl carrier protein
VSGTREDLLHDLLLEKYEPIAIIGVGLRFPGGNRTPEQFAAFLRAGGSGMGPVPDDRWDVDRYYSAGPVIRGRTNADGGGFVDDVDAFDAAFFNISPKEARFVDPQQRMVLEAAWEALEDAGIDPTALRGTCSGVYIGVATSDYHMAASELADEDLDPAFGTGLAHSAVAGRVSYVLGLHGPSIALDTACSSSVVALDLAVTGLRRRDCNVAICGGVNLIHSPINHIVFSQAGMLAPDGRCKTFDDSADGYARSEGVGAMILKRFSDAKRDGDRVIALVRGTAVRQDGERGGLSVPNSLAQEDVMRAALAGAALAPADIQYVEAHGTGTALGDPIEMRSIAAVFAESHTSDRPLLVASLKTNIGHMEAAAGIGGLIKTALQLRDAQIYPHLHLEKPSTRIPWSRLPVAVPTGLAEWDAPVRRALVNSFGFAGTIAAAVLEQAPPRRQAAEPEHRAPKDAEHVFVLSAKSERALRQQIGRYRDYVRANPDAPVQDIAHTAAVGRAHFEHRVAGVVSDADSLFELLDKQSGALAAQPPTVAMLFTGQGSQYAGMGRPLYERHPVFREHLDACDRLFEPYLDRSVRALILGDADDPALIDQTRFTQPALFALEYATAKLWMSWGVEPAVVLGHSIGEVVAAAVAGLFSLPDAVRLVAVRSRLMQSVTEPGGMVSVHSAADVVEPLLSGYPDVALAAINTPRLCVVSGGSRSLAAIVGKLAEQRIRTEPLAVSHAFHSPLMAEIAEAFAEGIAGIEYAEPERTLISNVTGEPARFEQVADPAYWVRQVESPVRFADGLRAIAARGSHLFLEVGPKPTLIGLGRRCVESAEHTWIGTMRAGDDSGSAPREAVAAAYRAGARIDWREYRRGAAGRRITLPTYAFDRRRHWLPEGGRRAGSLSAVRHPLLGVEITDAERHEAGWRVFSATISPDEPGYLREHVVFGQIVVPGAAYVELLLAAQDAVFGQTDRPLHDIEIHEPLILSDDRDVELVTRLRTASGGGAEVEVVSRIAGAADAIERRHVTARIGAADELLPELAGIRDRLREPAGAADAGAEMSGAEMSGEEMSGEELYSDFDDVGLPYGPQFRRIKVLWRSDDGRGTAVLRGHDAGIGEHLPPFLLDGLLQAVAGVLADGRTHVPVRFDTVQLLRKPKGVTLHGLLHVTARDSDGAVGSADLMLLDGDRPVAIVRGLGFRQPTAAADEQRRLFHQPRWTKRMLVRKPGEQPRDVLVVGRTAEQCPDLVPGPAGSGATVRYAADASVAADLLAQREPTDLCWFWTPGRDVSAAMTVETLRQECERNYRDLLALLSTLSGVGVGSAGGRLWLVTEKAQLLPDDEPTVEPALPAATLWGFGRTLWNEYPGFRVTLVDLDGDHASLLDEIRGAEAEEFQIAYRGGKRHVLRIFAVGQAGLGVDGKDNDNDGGNDGGNSDNGDNFELAVPESGAFAGIRRVAIPDRAPVGAEIRVQMHAVGLNFKDALNALGVLERHARETGAEYHRQPLGFEGAGTVRAAGPDAEFEVGAEVVVSHSGCLRKLVTVPSAAAIRKPANLGFVEAAGLPTAYLTAYYALHSLAKMKAGDKVLIHAAAGGVGQAAVALARLAGAEVFATASPGKHAFLRAQGVAHVLNSRTLDFAEQIREITGGAGVDIVLNSLSNDFVPAGLSTLARGGRFVELGKIGIWSPDQVRRARPDAEYFTFDLGEFPDGALREILQTVAGLLADGSIPPITATAYTLDEVEEAFGVLSRGAAIGKAVIDLTEPGLLGSAPQLAADLAVDPAQTVLITGGLGALGRIAAGRLAAQGARRIAVVGRRAFDGDAAEALRADLGPDLETLFLRGDVADPTDVERIFAEVRAGGHRIGGVVHAAGVLADGPVSTMAWEQIDEVFQAKVYGTWALHEAVARHAPDAFFVGYSSIQSVLGMPGQANYAAGNAFLDTLLAWRSRGGRPGLAIGWGPWAEAGMAARLDDRIAKGLQAQGLRLLKPRAGSRALRTVLGQPLGQVLVGEVDWAQFARRRTLGNALYQPVARGATAEAVTVDVAALLALPRAERRAAIDAAVRSRVAILLHFNDIEDIASHAKFMELGLDSLGAVELKNALEAMFRTALAASAVFAYPTVSELVDHLDEQLISGDRR